MLVAALSTVLSVVANAQTKNPMTPQQKADRAAKALQKKLNLTPEQESKVDAIYAMRAAQLDSVKLNPGQRGNGKKRKAIAEAAQTKINAVLTPAQQQQYAQMKATQVQKMQARRMAKDSTAKKM